MPNSFWSSVRDLGFGSEADVETRLIVPLLLAIGYSTDDIGSKVAIVFQTGKHGRPYEADYVVYDGKIHSEDTSLIVSEVKSPTEGLAFSKRQAESYAFATRAPFLLPSNGIQLEIWQVRFSGSSELQFRCEVAGLASHRGIIESLIGKTAAIEYFRSTLRKSALAASNDFAAYIDAEARRAAQWTIAASRKLASEGGAKTCPSADLLANSPQGAVVAGASGFGKTTLA
ncbi:type I site-specific restriction endonuclease [Nitrobacteraceae bacterium AZCC 2161]